jgi:MFS family permease
LALFPCLSELLRTTSHSTVGVIGSIVMAVFMVGWSVGSVVFGVLADHIGRTRVMMITIVLYAICTGLCGIAQSWQELALYRFLVGCGIGGEISIGAVMVSECWRGKSRLHAVAALSTSFGVGYLIAALLNLVLGPFGWRALFFVGVAPALVTLYIRAKLKEPEQYRVIHELKKEIKARKSESLSQEEKDLIAFPLKKVFLPENRGRVAVVIALASASIIGYWAVLSWIPAWVNQLTGTSAVAERSQTAICMNLGAILAAGFGGLMLDRFGRRNAFRFAFTGALVTVLGMFLTVKAFGASLLTWVFFVGGFATLPFVLFFAYVPELFNADVRATAFGFSVQMGRVAAACAALAGGQIIAMFGGSYATAASTVSLVYLIGLVATFLMPATSGEVGLHPQFIRRAKQGERAGVAVS